MLLGSQEEDEEGKEGENDLMSMLASPRVNAARKTTQMDANMKRRTTNVHKTMNDKEDKFASGKKTELLKAQKEADELAKRKLE